jgi:hypothetical protein
MHDPTDSHGLRAAVVTPPPPPPTEAGEPLVAVPWRLCLVDQDQEDDATLESPFEVTNSPGEARAPPPLLLDADPAFGGAQV